jgi:beta-1,4-N-acetylglucosaminyltransferase
VQVNAYVQIARDEPACSFTVYAHKRQDSDVSWWLVDGTKYRNTYGESRVDVLVVPILAPTMILVGIAAVLLLLIRLAVVLDEIWRHRKQQAQQQHAPRRPSSVMSPPTTKTTKKKPPLRTLVILGSGGHTTELLTMTRKLPSGYYDPIFYCKASTDTTSLDRLRTFVAAPAAAGGRGKGRMDNKRQDASNTNSEVPVVYDVPRSREVGQSYLSSVLTTVRAFGASLALVSRLAPDVILCNGPGTCIPICLAAFLFRLFGLRHSNIVFVESFCRVQSLSLTGKILYYTIADVFLVHWTQLHAKLPHSVLTSAIVRNNIPTE